MDVGAPDQNLAQEGVSHIGNALRVYGSVRGEDEIEAGVRWEVNGAEDAFAYEFQAQRVGPGAPDTTVFRATVSGSPPRWSISRRLVAGDAPLGRGAAGDSGRLECYAEGPDSPAPFRPLGDPARAGQEQLLPDVPNRQPIRIIRSKYSGARGKGQLRYRVFEQVNQPLECKAVLARLRREVRDHVNGLFESLRRSGHPISGARAAPFVNTLDERRFVFGYDLEVRRKSSAPPLPL